MDFLHRKYEYLLSFVKSMFDFFKYCNYNDIHEANTIDTIKKLDMIESFIQTIFEKIDINDVNIIHDKLIKNPDIFLELIRKNNFDNMSDVSLISNNDETLSCDASIDSYNIDTEIENNNVKELMDYMICELEIRKSKKYIQY